MIPNTDTADPDEFPWADPEDSDPVFYRNCYPNKQPCAFEETAKHWDWSRGPMIMGLYCSCPKCAPRC